MKFLTYLFALFVILALAFAQPAEEAVETEAAAAPGVHLSPKDAAKAQRIRQELAALRESLDSLTPEGTIAVKVPAAEIEQKIAKLERKLLETEGKPAKVKAAPAPKVKSAERQLRDEFFEQYAANLPTESPCHAYAQKKLAKKNAEAAGSVVADETQQLSLLEKAKLKFEEAKCKLERSEFFVKFLEAKNVAQEAIHEATAPTTEEEAEEAL